MNDFICPKCNQPGLPSIYLPMCTSCANIARRKSGEIKDDNAAQHSTRQTEEKGGNDGKQSKGNSRENQERLLGRIEKASRRIYMRVLR